MQVKAFIKHVKDNVWPDSRSDLDQCKTALDVVLWKKYIIRELTQSVVDGEGAVDQPQEESKDASKLTFPQQV